MTENSATNYSDWTLFLDRDGVLNVKREGDYVKNIDEFVWIQQVPQTLAELSKIFKYLIIVTNQQGIGKGLMTIDNLNAIHNKLKNDVQRAGGQIHAIFYAPYLAADNHPDRKPGIGMLLKAKQLFPDINFEKSIMIGDSITDMIMADKAGLKKVFISSCGEQVPSDYVCDSLAQFLSNLKDGTINFL